MAKLELEPVWTLKVTAKELNMIRAGLGGRLRPDDREAAKELDDDLARQTVGQTRQRLGQADKLARAVGEAE